MASKIEFFEVQEGPVVREHYRVGNKTGHVDDDIKNVWAKEYALYKSPPQAAPKKAPRKKK